MNDTATILRPDAASATENFPAKPIHIIVPFPAGASLDTLVRIVAQKMGENLNDSIVVENRTGASGIVGLTVAKKAPADGYTLVTASNSFVANPLLRSDLPYSVSDFAPITLLAIVPHVLVARPSLPVDSVKALVEFAKQNPAKLNYSSGGSGTMSNLGGEMLKKAAGIQILHIPYRGQGPALTALLGGQVDLTLGNLPEVVPYVKAHKLKALAILAPKRSALAPQIPTISEAGYPGVYSDSWYGLMAPAKTPTQVIRRLQLEAQRALAAPDVRKKLGERGFELVGDTTAEFEDFMEEKAVAYKKVIDEAKIRLK